MGLRGRRNQDPIFRDPAMTIEMWEDAARAYRAQWLGAVKANRNVRKTLAKREQRIDELERELRVTKASK